MARAEVPRYDDLQQRLARATAAIDVDDVLDLGTGTGEALLQVLPFHPGARAIGVDGNEAMLAEARFRLIAHNVRLVEADLSDPLPPGPFHLVVSVLAIHHLDGPAKADLYRRVAEKCWLRAGGSSWATWSSRPTPGAPAPPPPTATTRPSTVAEQVDWLRAAGLVAVTVRWQEGDLAVITADRPSTPY